MPEEEEDAAAVVFGLLPVWEFERFLLVLWVLLVAISGCWEWLGESAAEFFGQAVEDIDVHETKDEQEGRRD